MIDTFAFGGCMNLKDIRVLSAEWEDGLGGHDPFYYDGYYGPCIGYYYGESGNYEKIPGIVVTCVRTNLAGPNLDPDPLSIEEYCIDNGIDCQGFPLDKPKWEEREDGVYAVWDAPEAYINPSYTLTVMKDGKYSGQINMWAGLDEQGFLNQPTFFNFSEYMRANLDYLGGVSLIPLDKELENVEHYLELEKMRYGDNLEIEYDIDFVDIMIPPMVIQVLAENAVKHGIENKADGIGRIVIRTRRMAKSDLIIVEDNGVGFDINEINRDDGSHIGIKNVRERLNRFLGATLIIESEIGKSTVATISIPRNQKDSVSNKTLFQQKTY